MTTFGNCLYWRLCISSSISSISISISSSSSSKIMSTPQVLNHLNDDIW